MSLNYEELDRCATPLGELMLRRRRMIQLGDQDIYEVKLGDEFLMTSLFHEAEEQLANLALAACEGGSLHVVVGGLGLGYTARAALGDRRVSSLEVVEYLEDVIRWHKEGMVPLGRDLVQDPRCIFYHQDFFKMVLVSKSEVQPLDAILLDIDHTPEHFLHESNARLYEKEGLQKLSGRLKPDGVFGLWADGSPNESFEHRLGEVFDSVRSHTIKFRNPITMGSSFGAVYVGKKTA